MPDDTSLDLVRLADEVAARLISTADGPRPNFTTLAREWEPGHINEQGTVVFHEGGIWQARLRTASRPAIETAEWVLLTNGIRFVQSYQDPDDPRVFGLLIGFTGGRSRDLRYRLALPHHRGQYRAGVHYFPGDEVEHDGATFRSTIETPLDPPGGEGWVVVAARGRQGLTGESGPKGDQGDQGDRGLTGETGRAGRDGSPGERGPRGFGIARVEGLSDQPGFMRVVLDDGSLSEPIDLGSIRYVGLYIPGNDYRRGDIVRLGFALWIAAEDTSEVPTAYSQTWSLFLVSPEVGISGGGDRDQPPDLPALDARYVQRTGSVMTGQLALPDGNPINVALRLGPDTSGFYYDPTGGMIIVCNPPGSAAMGWTATEIASGRDINMFDHLMTRLRDPVSPQDAATKAYVDANAGGGGDFLPLVGGLLTGPLVMISSAGADAEIGITVGGRQAQIYWGNALVMRRGTANESVYIENNNGSNRSEVLTQLLGDARYLQSADATARFLPITGGVMTGILSFAANQGIVFGPLASVIYEDPTTLRLRKTSNNADPTIEDNDGINRTRIVTELIGDARYLQPAAADNDYVRKDFGVMTGALLCTGGTGTTPGLMIGDNNTGFLRPSGIMLQLLVGGALVFTYTAAALFPGAAISMNSQHISGLPTPLVPGDAAPKSYVDSQIAGITAATAFRTQVWQPGDIVIPAGQVAPTLMLDVNFSLPAVGIRSLLITIDPLFRSNVPSGAQWSLVYTCPMLTPGGLGEVPMVVYKMTNDDYGMLLSTAKFNVAVDASSGSVRIQIYVACPTHQSGLPSITQAGSGNMRSLVTVQDLGPVT